MVVAVVARHVDDALAFTDIVKGLPQVGELVGTDGGEAVVGMGDGVVECDILGEVALERGSVFLDAVEDKLHLVAGVGRELGTRRGGHGVVAVVVVEGEGGDVVLHAGEVVEVGIGAVAVALAAEGVDVAHIVEEAVGLGEAAFALEEADAGELGDGVLHLGVGSTSGRRPTVACVNAEGFHTI